MPLNAESEQVILRQQSFLCAGTRFLDLTCIKSLRTSACFWVCVYWQAFRLMKKSPGKSKGERSHPVRQFSSLPMDGLEANQQLLRAKSLCRSDADNSLRSN